MKTPMPWREGRWLPILASVPFLGACAGGPNLQRPTLPPLHGYRAAETTQPEEHSQAASADDRQPWQAFGNPTLSAYLAEVVARNATLEAAEHALHQAQALAGAQAADQWPALQARYAPTRTKLAGNQGGNSPGIQGNGQVISTQAGTPAAQGGQAPFNQPVIYNFHTAQVSVAYTLDVFQGQRFQRVAMNAQADASRWQLAAARAALVTQGVAAAVQDALLREQIEVLQAQLKLQREITRLFRQQLALGHASFQDLTQQQLQESQLQQGLPALLRQQSQNADALRTLAGWPPDAPLPAFLLDDFHPQLPAGVPLPSRLLERRPDVQAADALLRAAEAAVGASHAARLPQFSLTANWGGAAASPAQMLWQSGRFFDLTANVIAPLFDAGAGAQRESAALAQWRQSAALYRAAALQALQDVADCLHALESDRQTLDLTQEAITTADRLARLADAQREAGYIGRVDWAQAQLAQWQSRGQRAQAQAAWLADLAALLQALGGDLSVPQADETVPLLAGRSP